MRKKILFVALGVVLLAAVVAASIARRSRGRSVPGESADGAKGGFPVWSSCGQLVCTSRSSGITVAPYKADPTGASAIQKAVDDGYAFNMQGTPLTWYYVGESYRGGAYNIPGANVGKLFKRGHSTIVMPK